MMKIRFLLAALALFAAVDGHAAPRCDADFGRICDSTLSAAEVLAGTDPARVPETGSCVLLVMGLGLLGVAMLGRRFSAPSRMDRPASTPASGARPPRRGPGSA
jgi:hypothetical protein